MRFRQLAKYGLASALASLGGCSLLVDTADLDRGCASDEKLCSGHCVLQSDPAYGCTRELCAPCALTNAEPSCVDGACEVKACLFGFGCPTGSGCTVNVLVDKNHCGECMRSCSDDQSCRDGHCVRS